MFYVYRPHRGSLDESMRELTICQTIDSIKKLVIDEFLKSGVVLIPDDITLSGDTINDDRIGWTETRYVCVAHIGDKRFDVSQCVGMCCDSEHIPVEIKLAIDEYLNGDGWEPSFSIRSIDNIKPESSYTELPLINTKNI